VTLTDNVQRIQRLAAAVAKDADNREYELAQCDLDDIEAKVHALRRHLDRLQWFTSKVPRPRGDSKP